MVSPLAVNQPVGRIYRYTPQCDRYRHQQKRVTVTPKHRGSRRQERQLHCQPAPVAPTVIAVELIAQPQTHLLLHAVHRQRHQHHHKSSTNARRNRQAAFMEILGQHHTGQAIQQAQRHNGAAAEGFPTERHKQRHRADGQQAAEVIQHMIEAELRHGALLRLPQLPQGIRLLFADNLPFHRLLQMVFADIHSTLLYLAKNFQTGIKRSSKLQTLLEFIVLTSSLFSDRH